jgi:hypothetical protein
VYEGEALVIEAEGKNDRQVSGRSCLLIKKIKKKSKIQEMRRNEYEE